MLDIRLLPTYVRRKDPTLTTTIKLLALDPAEPRQGQHCILGPLHQADVQQRRG